jgi:adenine phosphoribosyltransferase
LLRDPEALRAILGHWATLLPDGIDYLVGIEARGFVLGAPLAYALGCGFVPARKAGKLPGTPRSITYQLEYGTATVEIAQDALPVGSRVVVVDDLLATGGTAAAVAELLGSFDIDLLGVSFLVELVGLGGREKLGDLPLSAVWSVQN